MGQVKMESIPNKGVSQATRLTKMRLAGVALISLVAWVVVDFAWSLNDKPVSQLSVLYWILMGIFVVGSTASSVVDPQPNRAFYRSFLIGGFTILVVAQQSDWNGWRIMLLTVGLFLLVSGAWELRTVLAKGTRD